MSPKIWLTRVVARLVMLMVVAGGLGALCVEFSGRTPASCLTVVVTEVVIPALGWWGVFDAKERGFALRIFSEISRKVKALA